MKPGTVLAVVSIVATASCSSGPAAPSRVGAADGASLSSDGRVGAAAVTTERLQLRRSGGSTIITPQLTNGQVLDVPLNVELDVWAEIRRLETDRARLVVNWGNGNDDFAGCGSCRLTNTYTREGRYTLTARVVDLNAPTDSAIIASATVTLNVIDLPKLDRLTCAPVTQDFETLPAGMLFPLVGPGVTVSSPVGGNTVTFLPDVYPTSGPELTGRAAGPDGSMVLTFDTDKTAVTFGLAVRAGDVVGFKVFDSQGSLVGSGPLDISIPTQGFFLLNKGTVNIQSAPFRRVVVDFIGPHTAVGFFADNIRATCK